MSKSIKLCMYYGKFDKEENVYRWQPTLVSVTFTFDPQKLVLKETVDDLRILMGCDPKAPRVSAAQLQSIIPKYFYPQSSIIDSEEMIEAILELFKNETANNILADHILACQDLYKYEPLWASGACHEGNEKYAKGDYVGALERYLHSLIHELPPIGLFHSLTLIVIALAGAGRCKEKCEVLQSKSSDYKLADILTNIIFNLIKKWFITNNDDLFTHYLIHKLRPVEYNKHIAGKSDIDMAIQSKFLFNYLLKHYPLDGVTKLQLTYSNNAVNITENWTTMIDKIDQLRGLMDCMAKAPQFHNLMSKFHDDKLNIEYAIIAAYLYRKPRLCRLMAYYGYQITQFGYKSRQLSSKTDHKEVQGILKQLFHEVLDLLKVVIDEDLITQSNIGLETTLKVLKTLIKVYQFINTDQLINTKVIKNK